MDKIFINNNIASTSKSEKQICDVIIKKKTSKVSDNSQTNFTKCARTSSGNSSFKLSTNKHELSRFNTLNYSFNNASSIASDFRRKIFEKLNENNNNDSFKQEKTQISNIKTNNCVFDTNNLQTTNLSNKREFLFKNKMQLCVKHQVQSTLSDPTRNFKLTGCKSCENCSQCKNFSNGSRFNLLNKLNSDTSSLSSLVRTSSVRKTMALFSNRLQLPKFMNDNEKDENKDGNKEMFEHY